MLGCGLIEEQACPTVGDRLLSPPRPERDRRSAPRIARFHRSKTEVLVSGHDRGTHVAWTARVHRYPHKPRNATFVGATRCKRSRSGPSPKTTSMIGKCAERGDDAVDAFVRHEARRCQIVCALTWSWSEASEVQGWVHDLCVAAVDACWIRAAVLRLLATSRSTRVVAVRAGPRHAGSAARGAPAMPSGRSRCRDRSGRRPPSPTRIAHRCVHVAHMHLTRMRTHTFCHRVRSGDVAES